MTEEKARGVGPYSRPHALAKLDRRTREARLMQNVREDLLRHLGGHASAVEAMLIERAAVLSLRVAMFDQQILEGGLSERNQREYLAISNTLTRLLRQLGMKGPAEAPGEALRRHNEALAAREAAERRQAAEEPEGATP